MTLKEFSMIFGIRDRCKINDWDYEKVMTMLSEKSTRMYGIKKEKANT